MWLFDNSRHYMQLLGSFVFFQWLSGYLSPQLSQYLPTYNNLTTEKKTEWHSRTCSTVHAILVSVACVYIIACDEDSKKDAVWGDSWIAKSNIAVASGYLLSDLYHILIDFKNVGDTWGYIFHHLSALYAYAYVLIYGVLAYFANFRLMAEVSTPFINLRWYYDIVGKRESQEYFYNGLLMTATFFICRIVVMPYYYYLVYNTFGTEGFDRLGFIIQFSWLATCIILDILNIFWFLKIVRGARKVMKSKKSAVLMNGNGAHKCLNNNTEKEITTNHMSRPKSE